VAKLSVNGKPDSTIIGPTGPTFKGEMYRVTLQPESVIGYFISNPALSNRYNTVHGIVT
jgi:hypothetical protein